MKASPASATAPKREAYQLLKQQVELAHRRLVIAKAERIDTTQLENGIYILRLRAEDVNGEPAEITRPVRVDGGAKVGLVQLSFTDLVTSDFGIPLAVMRGYDSRRAATSSDSSPLTRAI